MHPPRTDPQGLKSRPPESLLNHIPCALSTVADNEIVYQVVLFRELSIDECVKREMTKGMTTAMGSQTFMAIFRFQGFKIRAIWIRTNSSQLM